MTFLEAAIEILKREGKPLHFKDLTRLAIKHNLLTVVGRDPEGTMEAQLTAALKRESEGLVQTKAGLFGLRVFPPRSKTQRNQMSAREAQEEPENLSRPRARGRRRPEGGGEASHVAAAANTEGEAMNNHA